MQTHVSRITTVVSRRTKNGATCNELCKSLDLSRSVVSSCLSKMTKRGIFVKGETRNGNTVYRSK